MNSLQELNNFAAPILDYLDDRPSGVRFDREYPLTAIDQELNISSLIQNPQPGIEILEIINYQTANVRYRVTIQTGAVTPLVGSTVSWGSLPSGVTLSQVGNVYTISGIHSTADWDAVKNFTWTLPIDYASYPLWYLTVEIIYYNSELAQDVIMDWIVYDDRFYWVAQLSGTAGLTVFGGIKYPLIATLSSTASMDIELFNKVDANVNLSSTATIECSAMVGADFFYATASMTVQGKLDAIGVSSMSASASMTTNGLAIAINLDERTYLANTGNQIFATNTPQVDTPIPATDTISIELSSALGQFAVNSTDAPVSTLTISGTKAAVNNALLNVHFYPTKGSSSSGIFTWQQSLNSVVQFTKTISLTGFANSFAATTVTYNTSQYWIPTRTQKYYGFMDYLIVGGGGGGGQGGGGGGGQVVYQNNQSITQTSYFISPGAGGAGGTAWDAAINLIPNGTTQINNGADGSYSYIQPANIAAISAKGGDGGKGIVTKTSQFDGTYNFAGGDGGGTYTGGTSSWTNQIPGVRNGGGGAGAGENGTSVTDQYGGGPGGDGVSNNITGSSVYYGGGGGGGKPNFNLPSDIAPVGGLGGGGNGMQSYLSKVATAGTDGLGGGGGGGAYFNSDAPSPLRYGANGGRGVVIIKVHA